MKRIVEIVPARPGWYSRWQVEPERTRCYPVSLWALVEESDGGGREVIGVDCVGQWPGAPDDGTDAEFVRYLFRTPDSGPPEDAEPTTEPHRVGPYPVPAP
ncbi:hypothetical protein ACLQ2S_12470 [Micromonospora sp. DT48]|uniref:hypothetical protein n=1 Tax=unclassified Micromonospora TaxID=2617518 RepID=UPI0012BCC249|nr:hypothetical protein [Micromonospora sp. CP22]MTK04096.1 hypothetical protein [Micromonospora sp. CP22]